MKRLLFALCAAASAGVLALVVHPATLPPSSWADTEVSTNVPFAAGPAGTWLRDFHVGMSFLSTPSNNVQFAFGRDADGDGVLSIAEMDLLLGWDCGMWRLGDESRRETVTENDMKDLSWTLRMRDGSPHSLEVSECGMSLTTVTNASVLAGLYDPAWNLVRITVRGVDQAAERLVIAAYPWGCVLRFR